MLLRFRHSQGPQMIVDSSLRTNSFAVALTTKNVTIKKYIGITMTAVLGLWMDVISLHTSLDCPIETIGKCLFATLQLAEYCQLWKRIRTAIGDESRTRWYNSGADIDGLSLSPTTQCRRHDSFRGPVPPLDYINWIFMLHLHQFLAPLLPLVSLLR